MQPLYDDYSLEELLDVQANIDRKEHPERFNEICKQIEVRRSKGEGIEKPSRISEQEFRRRDRIFRFGFFVFCVIPLIFSDYVFNGFWFYYAVFGWIVSFGYIVFRVYRWLNT